MWEATIRCTSCEREHVVSCADEVIPRVFAYVCPRSTERVDVRYRDPSRMVRDWAKVDGSARGAIAVDGTQSRGAIE